MIIGQNMVELYDILRYNTMHLVLFSLNVLTKLKKSEILTYSILLSMDESFIRV